ncbi:MAG TPA: preprotein translocase subunit SecA, partial [Kiritimatiellae bacterium]|nr:preprotein translocase subunit SecA [Kiritimatiellia bacterium]
MYEKLAGMTGTAETEAEEFHQIYGLDVVVIPTNRPVRRVDFNDLIYKTQREKFAAIIDQIEECHRRGQPVLVGTISVEKSEVLSRMLRRRGIPHNVLNAKNHEREAEIVARAGQKGAVTIATNMAGRGTDIKLGEGVVYLDRRLIESDLTLDSRIDGKTLRQLLEEKPCGLFVIGSERHEARRIDRQLRGRCARQGDPGCSQFFVSLEDDLMRLFGSDRIAGIMEKLGLEEGQVLEHRWLNRSIENAQRRVEQHNFAIRKRTLEYDDVMNRQREVIYDFRSSIIRAADAREHLYDIAADVVYEQAEALTAGAEQSALSEFTAWVNSVFPLGMSSDRLAEVWPDPDKVTEVVAGAIRQAYETKAATEEPEALREMERAMILQAIDSHWQEFLRAMDSLREGIALRAYGQRDPLVEYKREAYSMFADLMSQIKRDIAHRMFRSATSLEALETFLASLPQAYIHEEVSALETAAAA